MSEHHDRQRRKRFQQVAPGAVPGAIVALAGAQPTRVSVIGYGADELVERREIEDDADVLAARGKHAVTWIDVVGLADSERIARLGEALGVHRLATSDLVHVHQRPKLEDYGPWQLVIARMPHPELGGRTEQLGLLFGPGVVMSFQERPGDCFEAVRNRLRESRGRIRSLPALYLVYALLDAVVDSYYAPLEAIGDELDELEEALMIAPRPDIPKRVYQAKRELVSYRRALWPMRDALSLLYRDEETIQDPVLRPYFRDCHDHCTQALDEVESGRELAAALLDLHLSAVGHHTNEIMGVLTAIATIFIPLTFVTGIYGMNFDADISPWNMPETRWYLGYPIVMTVMFVITVALTWFFWRKGLLGRGSMGGLPTRSREEGEGK
jgi:magnesium transporter